MPTKQKIVDNKVQTQNISKWLFWAPLKFSGLLIALMMPLLILMNFVLTHQYSETTYIISIIITFVISMFAVYKLMRWTDDDNLDQKSFIMLNICQNVICLTLLTTIGFLSLLMPKIVNFNMAVGLAIIIGLLTIFMVGNGLLKFKAFFCRARSQGVPKWKLWLSMPLGINLFWYPGFLVSDKKDTAQVIKPKFKFCGKLINWVVKKQSNTIAAFLVAVLFVCPIIATGINAIIIFYIVSIVILALLLIWKKLRNNIGGIFATGAFILNIAVIIGALIALSYIPTQPVISGEQISITETINK